MHAFCDNVKWSGWQGKMYDRFLLVSPEMISYITLMFGETVLESAKCMDTVLYLGEYSIHRTNYGIYSVLTVTAKQVYENTVIPTSFIESSQKFNQNSTAIIGKMSD